MSAAPKTDVLNIDKHRGFSRGMARPAVRARRSSKCRGSSRVGPGGVFEISWVGSYGFSKLSDRVASCCYFLFSFCSSQPVKTPV